MFGDCGLGQRALRDDLLGSSRGALGELPENPYSSRMSEGLGNPGQFVAVERGRFAQTIFVTGGGCGCSHADFVNYFTNSINHIAKRR